MFLGNSVLVHHSTFVSSHLTFYENSLAEDDCMQILCLLFSA